MDVKTHILTLNASVVVILYIFGIGWGEMKKYMIWINDKDTEKLLKFLLSINANYNLILRGNSSA